MYKVVWSYDKETEVLETAHNYRTAAFLRDKIVEEASREAGILLFNGNTSLGLGQFFKIKDCC